ncbi:sensor histidine kinase [Porphyrobacter sp. GA68]|uniref:sensor histidine kinase n=1 Tax=Porphyrobacter sp. GA68 TaxID=2883480 RepID=UPI001D184B9D|nr:histidine kinase dimerization/phosphoacceptor domain -containing protein [Porphyrobacter sp. GA68]
MSDTPSQSATDFLRHLPLARNRPWVGYTVAMGLSFAAWWVRWTIGSGLPAGFPYLTFFPAVILTAFLFGLRPGLLAAILSFLAAWYFFVAPFNSFELHYDSSLALGFFIFIVSVELAVIHWMQTANQQLFRERERSAQLAETREMLFKELQHRVGNNIQMVGSLLALQKRRVTEPAARDALDEASRRLGLVGRIQRQLYDPAGAQLSLAAYIDQICRDVIAASGRADIDYQFEAHSNAVLPPEKAIPTALVVAEALNNALEHGFGLTGEGQVIVTVAPVDGGTQIVIADNGAGLPAGFDLAQAESLGLKIARTLAQSLGGSFTMSAAPVGEGTVARLEIASDLPEPPLPG